MSHGIIALDIDGTLTDETHHIHPQIIAYLAQLQMEGWRLIFITGRTYSWGYLSLKDLPCPYHLSVQNGAILLEMPAKKVIARKYIDAAVLPVMEQICQGEPSDFVIYTGIEESDACFYRPEKFAPDLLQYLQARCKHLDEVWTPVASFDNLPMHQYPSIKCFGLLPSIERIAARIELELGLNVPPIRDPFQADHYVAQATHPYVNKGFALKDFAQSFADPGCIIAAGDDNNDRSMLAEAAIKVVMANAPRDMLASADVIAPPASQNGILTGLQHAVAMAKNR